MREEIWNEKIFKVDAGYFLRITKIIFAFTRKIFQFFLFIKRRLPNFVIRNVATVSDSLTFSLELVALSLGLVALSLGVRTQNPRSLQWDELPQDQEERLVAFLRQNTFLRRTDAAELDHSAAAAFGAWAQDAVLALDELDILLEPLTDMDPTAATTRAEAAALMYNFMAYSGILTSVETGEAAEAAA